MAEASKENTTLDTRTTLDIVSRLSQLIENNSLDEIKTLFETLEPEQCIKVLSTTIRGFLPLYIAVHDDKFEISRYLLQVSLLHGPEKISECWKECMHPLRIAIVRGNQELIQLILQHLPDINDTIIGPISPLTYAILVDNIHTVKLIVAMGADINRPSLNGMVPLMHSTCNGEICKFLISKDANVNHQDEEGFSVLHLAIAWDHREGITLLINAGADVKIQSHEGMNPLIWAAIHQNLEIVEDLGMHPSYSELDKIEALEILNACFLCDQIVVLVAWRGTLAARWREGIPKTCHVPPRAILDYSVEFTTEEELENLREEPLSLAYQSILVVERILGRNNRLYVEFLLQTALIAKEKNNMEKVKELIDHIQEYSHEKFFVGSNLLHFKTLFTEIAENSYSTEFFSCGGFAIFKIIAQTTLNLWFYVKERLSVNQSFVDSYYSSTVDTFLYMAFKTNKVNSSQEYLGEFREEVKRVLNEDLRVVHRQSVLHRALKLTEEQSWASVELIRFLLEAGADVNSIDDFGRTPAKCALEYVPKNIRIAVLELFDEYGAQKDC